MVSRLGSSDLRRLVRLSLGPLILTFACTAHGADGAAPTFADAASLEQFVLAAADADVKRALETALTIDGANQMIALAAKVGPAYAIKAAGMLPDPVFREGYRDLARYLDLYGPCHKQGAPGEEGWWSNYPDPPHENYCGEAAKLLYSALLWNQVHYCVRLVTGEDKPKIAIPNGKQPPYRLDEPPVATHWLHAGALYAIADAALRFGLAKTLRARSGSAPDRVRDAMLTAASELERDPPNRELAALALAKLLLRRYEQSHLDHLARLETPPAGKSH